MFFDDGNPYLMNLGVTWLCQGSCYGFCRRYKSLAFEVGLEMVDYQSYRPSLENPVMNSSLI